MLHLTRRAFAPLASAAVLALAISGAHAQDKFITVQSTTSTEASGLYDYLLPIFTEKTGIDVRVVAVGTGQALKNAENCDGDVLVVHAKPAEEEFVEAGFGTERTDVMYNDFIIVGPSSDPAGISGSKNVREALAKIAEA
ncbi:MAG TPA: substrate-binding domain-containing protein, partial [Paracoccaceae bacterium]|nr:substrate-binding domain-containing protein [Paracoccaceae bacterium]